MRKQTRAWLELAILLILVCFLLLLAYYKMLTLSASITAFASLIIARYTMLLAYVGEKTNELQEQIAGLQGDAVKVAEGSNVIQLWAQKIATNPDLKVFVQGHWQSSNHMQLNQMDEQGNVARTSFTANWQANLLLWNTGTGTILVKSWDVDDETGRRNLWISLVTEAQTTIRPPLLVPSQGQVLLNVRTICEGHPMLRFTYATSQEDQRTIDVKIGEN